ncbi:MAG: ATP-binding cassette domain-containing protein [Bacillota bacterium]|jgi:energy-coupling factor transport system ATP-binding protein
MHIRLDNVSYMYKEHTPFATPALQGINLYIPEGEFVVVVGHSGSGKSTLAQVISGLLSPQEGIVTVDGKKANKDEIFYQVGLVFQYPEQQFFADTVKEEVGFAAKNKGLSQEKVDKIIIDVLQKVGLDPSSFLERSPFALSGGEKRKVALASILAMEPQIFIFDEPTAGLDEKGRAWIMDLIRAEHRAGKTVIWISHSMEEAAALAQRVVVMNKGSIVLDGKPQEVFADEEKLFAIGLELTPAADLLRRLKKRNFPVLAHGLTIEEAFAEIRAVLWPESDDDDSK